MVGVKDFQKDSPGHAEIEIDKENYVFSNGEWSSKPEQKNPILFFDTDFIHKHVHTHGDRSSNLQQGGHTQKAGALIIELDENANRMREEIESLKEKRDLFKEANKEIRNNKFSDQEEVFYGQLKEKTEAELSSIKKDKSNTLLSLSKKAHHLHKLREKHSDLKNIKEVPFMDTLPKFSDSETYKELINREIKEKASSSTDEHIKSHFSQHKDFLQLAQPYIPKDYNNESCPLCMQPLSNAVDVIEFYKTIFDKSYDKAKEKLKIDATALITEIENIKKFASRLPIRASEGFGILEKASGDFSIEGVYNSADREKWEAEIERISNFPKEIEHLLESIRKTNGIPQEDDSISELHETVRMWWENVKKVSEGISQYLKSGGKKIDDFKKKYANSHKIDKEISQIENETREITTKVDFLKSGKISQMKLQKKAIGSEQEMGMKIMELEDKRDKHLSTLIPEKIIPEIKKTLKEFNLGFDLKQVKNPQRTKDFSFTFELIDDHKQKREFKAGLSEGERQIISLAFFFALIDNDENKAKKVLVFDDPITSLDAPNLKKLADLICQKGRKFSQFIVFTHHPLFYKYLVKNVTPKNPAKFGILRNKEEFGGSFIYRESDFDLLDEVKGCSAEISKQAKNGTLNFQNMSLRYGHLLRMATEKLVKEDLLMWHMSGGGGTFNALIKNLKPSEGNMNRLTDEDLQTIQSIHQYCDYANYLHVDKESSSALSELRNHIDNFVKIYERVRS